MTVDDTARIAIVLKKLNEAQNRLYEATKIYQHILDDKCDTFTYESCKIKEQPEECMD